MIDRLLLSESTRAKAVRGCLFGIVPIVMFFALGHPA